jgi:Lysine-specific metallo-endopeptidase
MGRGALGRFVRRVQPGLWPKARQPFNNYFGDPQADVDTSAIEFKANAARPTWPAAAQKRLEVVREVLRRVVQNIVRQEVRIYLGGRGIDAGTFAYVSGDMNPTKIHVGGRFFTRDPSGFNSQAGTIVHECTHTFAATRDHAYQPGGCRQLSANPLQALANADSYRFFVEAAFR